MISVKCLGTTLDKRRNICSRTERYRPPPPRKCPSRLFKNSYLSTETPLKALFSAVSVVSTHVTTTGISSIGSKVMGSTQETAKNATITRLAVWKTLKLMRINIIPETSESCTQK